MAHAFTEVKEWVDANGATVGTALLAGIQLAGSLTAKEPDKKPQEIFTGIPAADRAIAQAAGVAEIAGAEGVTIENVITVAKLLLGLGLTFV